MVAPEGVFANLKARVGDDPTIPPTTGWMFQNFDSKKFEEDPHLTCSSVMTALVSCSITVSLSGLAKDIQGECEAEYKDTGLISMGRQEIQTKQLAVQLRREESWFAAPSTMPSRASGWLSRGERA